MSEMLSSARSAAETAAGMNKGFQSVVQAIKAEAEKTRSKHFKSSYSMLW